MCVVCMLFVITLEAGFQGKCVCVVCMLFVITLEAGFQGKCVCVVCMLFVITLEAGFLWFVFAPGAVFLFVFTLDEVFRRVYLMQSFSITVKVCFS